LPFYYLTIVTEIVSHVEYVPDKLVHIAPGEVDPLGHADT